MNLSLRIFRKDLRRYWPLAVLAAALIVVGLLGPLWAIRLSTGFQDLDNVLSGFGLWPVIFILVVAVVQEDVTVGDKAFWRTRPIRPGALLAGKILFFALALALPSLVANCWLTTTLDTPWRVALGMWIENTGFMLIAVLFLALLGSVTGSLLQAGVAAIAFLIAVAVAMVIWQGSPPELHPTLPWDTDMRFPGSRIVVACILAGAAFSGLLLHQFFTRRTRRTAILLVIAVPLVLFLAGQWHVDFISPDEAEPFPTTPLTMTEGVTLTVDPEATVNSNLAVWDKAASRPRSEPAVSVYVALHGLPTGRILEVVLATSSLRFRDGREMSFPSVPQRTWSYLRDLQEAAVCRALDLEYTGSRASTRAPEKPVRIFSLPKPQLAELTGQHARLITTFTLGERAFHEMLRLPARVGATWRHEGELWRVERIAGASPSGRWFAVRHLHASSVLAPYGSARPDLDNISPNSISCVLLNRKKGGYMMRAGFRAGVDSYRIAFTPSKGSDGVVSGFPLTDEWMADAELVFLRSETLGTTTKVATVEDFVVPSPDSTSEAIFQ